MTEIAKVLSMAHAVHEKMVNIRQRINDDFALIGSPPKEQRKNSPMRFTYDELTTIHGSIDASIKRLEAMYHVGEKKDEPPVLKDT